MHRWASTSLCDVLKLENKIVKRGNALFAHFGGKK
jgi:hypothetical protein